MPLPSLEAAQAAMRLDPHLIPPSGSCCELRLGGVPTGARFVVFFIRIDRYQTNYAAVLGIIPRMPFGGGNVVTTLPGELELIRLPPEVSPISKWKRIPSDETVNRSC